MLAGSYGLEHVTYPASTPITVAEAKEWLQILGNDAQNSFIEDLIEDATDWIEKETARAFVVRNYKLTLDDFPRECLRIQLPVNPVTAIVSVTYTDEAGATQTLDNTEYQLIKAKEPAELWPAPDALYWPYTQYGKMGAVEIVFTAGGYTPRLVKHAVKLAVAHLYNNGRESIQIGTIVAEVPLTLKSAIEKLKYGGFAH